MAISRQYIKLYISAANTNASSVGSSDQIIGEIKKYSKSGGEDDVKTEPVFGGYVDTQMPKSQYEIALDLIPAIGTGAIDWESYVMAADGAFASTFTSAVDATNKAVFIQAFDGGTGYKTWAFNNCNGVSIKMDHDAGDNQSATLTFKFGPMTSTGAPNHYFKRAAMTACPNWSALTSGS